MNKKSSIIIFFLFVMIVLSGRSASEDEGVAGLSDQEGRGVHVSRSKQRVQNMITSVRAMREEQDAALEGIKAARKKTQRFVDYALSQIQDGKIAVDMSKLPTDKKATLNDLFLAMGGQPKDA